MQISDLSIEDDVPECGATIRFTLTKDDSSVFEESETVTVTYSGCHEAEAQHPGNGQQTLQVEDPLNNVMGGLMGIIAQLSPPQPPPPPAPPSPPETPAQAQVSRANARPSIAMQAEIVSISVSGPSGTAVLRSWGSVWDEQPGECMTLVDADYECFDSNGVITGSGYIGQKSSKGYGGAFDMPDWVLAGVTAPGRTVVTFRGRTIDFWGFESSWKNVDVEFMVPADPNYSGN